MSSLSLRLFCKNEKLTRENNVSFIVMKWAIVTFENHRDYDNDPDDIYVVGAVSFSQESSLIDALSSIIIDRIGEVFEELVEENYWNKKATFMYSLSLAEEALKHDEFAFDDNHWEQVKFHHIYKSNKFFFMKTGSVNKNLLKYHKIYIYKLCLDEFSNYLENGIDEVNGWNGKIIDEYKRITLKYKDIIKQYKE